MTKQLIVIMAGGSGTRLWPLSRKNAPKQFQALMSEQTLLEETFERAKSIVEESAIFVSTTETLLPLVQKILPNLSQENIIVEPASKNTAPAIGLVAAHIENKFPKASVATIPSDHAINNPEAFTQALTTAFQALEAKNDALITIGINPTRPDTGFGYIQLGDEFSHEHNQKVFVIENFKEKPDKKTAEKYYSQWEYLWNAGYFIFKTDVFLQWLQTYTPDIFSAVTAGDPDQYEALTNTPVEPAIIEKLPKEHRLVIPSDIEWNDIGSWQTLLEELQKKNNVSVVSQGSHVDLGSKNTLVKNTTAQPVVTLGLDDIIIVQTPDCLLVADKKDVSESMKTLLEQLGLNHSELL